MCLVCIEIMNERMTLLEAQRALPELIHDAEGEEEEHLLELYDSVVKDLMEMEDV